MAKLGYTWFTKDWRSNMEVQQLSLQEKGFYRELIDECYLQNSNKITVNERTFCRLHGINRKTFRKLIGNLSKTSLIVIENLLDNKIAIASVSKRLKKIDEKDGDNPIPEKTPPKPKEKDKPKPKTKDNGVFKSFLLIFKEKLNKDFRSEKQLPNLLKRLEEGFTMEQIEHAIENMKNDTFHKENKYTHITPEFVCRIDKLEKFININPIQVIPKENYIHAADIFPEANK